MISFSNTINGIYNALCYISLRVPIVLEHLDLSIIPESIFLNPETSAMHHNRDYYILYNMEQVLTEVKNALQSLDTMS